MNKRTIGIDNPVARAVLFVLLGLSVPTFGQQPLKLLIGTYTNTGKSEGIYVCDFDSETGTATITDSAAADNPSFLTVNPNTKFVYAVNENGDGLGAVSAFAFDRKTGRLSFLNRELTQGDHPCHVVTDPAGQYLIVSNYSGGSVSVFPLLSDGRIGSIKQLIRHTGNGPDKSRQEAPHVHSAFFTPDGRTVYVQDLGTDKVHCYAFRSDVGDGPLVPRSPAAVLSSPGGGPRHLAQSENGQFIYLVQEMTAKVMVYAVHNEIPEAIQEVDMNDEGFSGGNGAADIKRSPDGRFLYASNRGDANAVTIYRINPDDGTLVRIGSQEVLGKGPRNIALSPDGRFLLVANQYTDEVVVFARNVETGLLNDTGHRIAVGAPVCLVFTGN